LKSLNFKNDEINRAVNFCILPATSNRLISDKKPSDYFVNIIPQANLTTILDSNLISTEKNTYIKDDYNLFYKERAKIIFDKI